MVATGCTGQSPATSGRRGRVRETQGSLLRLVARADAVGERRCSWGYRSRIRNGLPGRVRRQKRSGLRRPILGTVCRGAQCPPATLGRVRCTAAMTGRGRRVRSAAIRVSRRCTVCAVRLHRGAATWHGEVCKSIGYNGYCLVGPGLRRHVSCLGRGCLPVRGLALALIGEVELTLSSSTHTVLAPKGHSKRDQLMERPELPMPPGRAAPELEAIFS